MSLTTDVLGPTEQSLEGWSHRRQDNLQRCARALVGDLQRGAHEALARGEQDLAAVRFSAAEAVARAFRLQR